ncbi:MAG: hypothetical protein WBZ01_21445 [Terriglobales bacterium]
MKLVQFTDNRGKEHWINAERVCSVMEYGNGVTQISFGTDQGTVLIKEAVGLVVKKLFSAGKA